MIYKEMYQCMERLNGWCEPEKQKGCFAHYMNRLFVTQALIEKVHLDDLNVYLDTLDT